jgi:hypothetical protein
MGHDERFDVVEAVFEKAEVGQDQVDARLVVGGEQHPAVHDEQSAEMFENGHVATDFVDATQRGDPEPTRGERPRRGQMGVH